MNKAHLKSIMRQQACSLNIEVQKKLQQLMSDEAFEDVFEAVFADIEFSQNIEKAGKESSLEEAFQSALTSPAPQATSTPHKNISEVATRLAERRQRNRMMSTPTSKVSQNELANKIVALRGCSLPGEYLIKK